MGGIRESTLQSKCIAYLKSKEIYFVNKCGDGRSGKGCPDLLVCIGGRFVAFELKVDNNDLSPAQRIHKKRILASGGLHYKPYTVEEFKRIVNALIVKFREGDPCVGCAWNDYDLGCTCPPLEKWYQCPAEPEPIEEDFN